MTSKFSYCTASIVLLLATTVLQPVAAHSQARVITVAGGVVNDGGPATSAALAHPEFAAYDATGNLYIAEYFGHRIRRVSPSGLITTVAGNGISGYNGDGMPAKHALVSFPVGILVDPTGNIIFADNGNNRIRKIDTNGIITTIAGNGTAGFTGDGGPATAASLHSPWGISSDAKGNLYIADYLNERVRQVNTAGIINTVAGNGTAGFSGDGGPAIAASLNFPFGSFTDTSGNLYIADFYNLRIRKVDTSGTINTFAGNGTFGCTGDGGPATSATIGYPGGGFLLSGNALLINTSGCGKVRAVDLGTNLISTYAGSVSGFNGDGNNFLTTEFSGPRGLTTDSLGNAILVDHYNDRIRILDTSSQTVTTIAGGYIGDGGPGTAASLNLPVGIAFDHADNLYIVDDDNNRIRKLSPGGTISTFAGTGISGYTGDGGPATSATLYVPQAVTTDHSGNVYIADQAGGYLRKVDPTGTITTITPTGGFFLFLAGLATDSVGNVYAADIASCVVWRITPSGVVSRVAGVPLQCGYNKDGVPATQAWLNTPYGVAVDSKGNIFIADTYNNRVRMVDHATKIISTVAGNGTCGFSGDGGPATSAMLCVDQAIAVDSKGNLYIADFGNSRVRSVDTSETIQTIAGTGLSGYNGNGLLATQTNLDSLWGIAVDTAGTVFLVDTIQSRVRKIH